MIAVWRRLRGRRLPLTAGQQLALTIAVWVGLLLLAWLDRRWTVHAQRLELFSAIVAAIGTIAGWLGTAAEVTAVYLAQAVAWVGTRLAHFITSSGVMFSKVWDAAKIVWADVLKPALVWIDNALKRVQAWLTRTLKPAFDFLKAVREHILDFYTKFVRPVVDTIEFIRAINRVLLTFHIHLLERLDRSLQAIEQRIEEPFLWINKKLNEIWNALDLVLTADGFFQRLTLIRSMGRYAPAWMRIAVNARSKPLTGDQAYAIERANMTKSLPQVVTDSMAYLEDGASDIGPVIDEAVGRAREYLDRA